jgi:hypothetical protein
MKIKVQLQLTEMEDNNFHLIAESVLPDKTTGCWIIDTGASKTVFDKNLSENYSEVETSPDEIHTAGIGEKPLESSVGRLKAFTLGKLKVGQMRVALLDLSHINNYYSKVASLKICGLLGSDFLNSYQAVIDYKKRQLILRRIF